MIKFSERLKELRIEKKISQAKLAKFFCVSQVTVSSWETGFRQPDFDTLEKISEYFDVTAGYLLGIED